MTIIGEIDSLVACYRLDDDRHMILTAIRAAVHATHSLLDGVNGTCAP
jgi:hypothetical protein